MFVKPLEKKIVNSASKSTIEAIEAKIRYLKEASAFATALFFKISVKDSIEKSSRHKKKRMKSEQLIIRRPELVIKKIISINS